MDVNLAMLVDIPAMIVGDDLALVDGSGERTYGVLRDAVGRTAGLLAGLGVGEGDRVAILSTNRDEVVEVLFAAAARGATAVPMNFRAGEVELGHLLSDSGARVLFVEGRYLDVVRSVRPDHLDHVVVVDDPGDYRAARDRAEPQDLIADVDDDDLAVLLYTSGTTALPKGVMLTHGALTGYVMAGNDAADGTTEGMSLLAAPLYHIAGLTALLNPLYTGRPTVLLPQFEPEAWLEAVERHHITHAFLVPTMLAQLLDHPKLADADLSSLQTVTYGAAPMPRPLLERAIGAFPPAVEWSGAYGQTETTSTVAVLGPDDHRLEGSPEQVAARRRRLSSVGRPLDDVELRVVDPLGRPLPAGEVGEVQLRTFRAMQGYWGEQEKTRVTLDEEGWVHTGDVGYLDDEGYLFLTGRAGDMIIRGGENVAPAEVESVLHEHPDVAEAAVVGVPDETWGERVVAAVVVRPGSQVSPEDLVRFCAERVAPAKRPEQVVILDELPRTGTGKVVRRDLRPVLEAALRP
ncbi:MAG TPA: AMP-binding protein [Acidimicrobiales bacterium]|nr:AMP-binding protein [Acidimicrobiales bacterium]